MHVTLSPWSHNQLEKQPLDIKRYIKVKSGTNHQNTNHLTWVNKKLGSPHITYSNVNIVVSKEKKNLSFILNTQYMHEYSIPGSVFKFIPGKCKS